MALCSARVVRGVRAGAVLGILVLVVMFIITGHNTDQLGRRSARSGLDSLHGALDETPGPGGERARRVAAADSGAAVQLAKPTRAAPPITTVPLHASVASPGAGAGRAAGGGGEQNLQQALAVGGGEQNLQQALAVGADGRPPSKSSLVEALRAALSELPEAPNEAEWSSRKEGVLQVVRDSLAGREGKGDTAGDVDDDDGGAEAAADAAVQEAPAKRKSIIIGVLTDPHSLRTIGMAAYTTWIRDVESLAKVLFFIGTCSSETDGFPGSIVCLDTPDTYPPQKKVFLMWKYLYENFRSEYNWFMKVDHDSYLNVRELRSMLETLSTPKLLDSPQYIGWPATGRKDEQAKLGINGKTYCLGLGYLMNHQSMDLIGPQTMNCFEAAVSNHSDTEIGRCMHRHVGIECSRVAPYVFKQVYYQQDGTHVFPMKLIRGGQMNLLFPRQPKAAHFAAVLVHPLKRAEDFYRFHKQTMSQLRPVQPQISKDSPSASYRIAIQDLKKTCVHNTVRQLERSKYALPECPTPSTRDAPVVPTLAHVLTRQSPDAAESFAETSSILLEHGIRARRVVVDGWTTEDSPGADLSQAALAQYLPVMRQLFRNATFSGAKRLLIMEDKVMFLCDFKNQLWQLLNNARCGKHLFTEQQGGVLLLGAHPPSKAGFDKVEEDRSRAFSRSNIGKSATMCYNVNMETKGSFAVIYHRSVFGEVLSWLDRLARTKRYLPFDQIYGHLSDKGYIVRAAFPNLVLRDVSAADESQLQQQAADGSAKLSVHMRWYDGKFCRRGGDVRDFAVPGS